MKKTNIKHLAPYLPYGLKVMLHVINKPKCRKYIVGTVGAVYSDGTIVCHDTVNAAPDFFKPILRPLADFKDINSDAFNELNYDLEHQLEICDVANRNIHYTSMTVGAYEICLQNHINIFEYENIM